MSAIITREHPDSADAVVLITELEAHLDPLYPAKSRHGYSVEKLIAQGVAFFVLRQNDTPAGCGGIQFFGKEFGELKRMYVRPQFRGFGFGRLLLDHLADHACAQGIALLRLETGIHQAAAIRLYERMGFQRIPPFGDYTEDPLSLYYEKRILPLPSEVEAMSVDISPMTPADWEQVRAIYVEGIASGQATFETETPSWDQWDAAHHPFARLAARRDGRVIGWAALSPVSRRKCYAGVAEVSVYVAASYRGRGVGRRLLEAVIVESERHGIWTLQGATFPSNAASLRLQQSCGFREIGRRERVAQLHGQWRDTILTERRSSVVGSPPSRARSAAE
ncbi:MAG TPA: GNAT family N-acetyltransferase [Gemmataceae bacterium]|jgi:L-amino acid N-acyltransferase YncA